MIKLTTYLLLCCYLLVTTGVVATSHDCSDRLTSVAVSISKDQQCSPCSSFPTTAGCCQDEQTLLKPDITHHKHAAWSYQHPGLARVPVCTTAFLLTALHNGFLIVDIQDRLPPACGPAIYLAHRVFRI